MFIRCCVVAMLVLSASGGAWAQARGPIPELRPMAGAYVPMGDQRDFMKDALMVGFEGAVEIGDRAHLLGTLAWSPSKNDAMSTQRHINLFQYDLGVEVFNQRTLGGEWMFKPFVGVGGGARTFDFPDPAIKTKTYLTGYGSVGTEFQFRRLALRVEGRDYIYRFKGVTGEEGSSTRNDLALVTGAAFHLW